LRGDAPARRNLSRRTVRHRLRPAGGACNREGRAHVFRLLCGSTPGKRVRRTRLLRGSDRDPRTGTRLLRHSRLRNRTGTGHREWTRGYDRYRLRWPSSGGCGAGKLTATRGEVRGGMMLRFVSSLIAVLVLSIAGCDVPESAEREPLRLNEEGIVAK